MGNYECILNNYESNACIGSKYLNLQSGKHIPHFSKTLLISYASIIHA